ncbi:SDR family NAD(P)-dependent oxidoreductase, partial [Thermodesulfobacteriota bacterium]
VIINDIVTSRAEKVAKEAEVLGVKALPITADVKNLDQVNSMIKKAIDEFGKVDILVNNAFVGDATPFSKSIIKDWEGPLQVCLYGTLYCSKAIINHMISRKYGKIINLISDAARVGEPWAPIYSTAKAGILAFSKSLAKEVGRYTINVNCVSPGATNTEESLRRQKALWDSAKTEEEQARVKEREKKKLKLYPLGRLGLPEDIANMIVYLGSDRCSWITGQAISVDGGYCMVS